MKRIYRCVVLFSVLFSVPAVSQEGFWQAQQLNTAGPLLTQLGLTAAEQNTALPLTAITAAVARVGQCSGAFISGSGLLITSSDCIAAWLPEQVKTGFSGTAELPLPGLTLEVLQQAEDVSLRLNRELSGIAEPLARADRLQQLQQQLISQCQRQADYRCKLKSLHDGLEYQLIRYKRLQDVRLAYMPPQNENNAAHSWPRYGANYAVLRAYVNADGQAADYHDTNQPYSTAFVALAAQGVTEQQLLLTPGFAGRSYRYHSAAELRFQFEHCYPRSDQYLQQLIQLLQQLAPAGTEAAQRYHPSLMQLQQQAQRQQAMLSHYQQSNMLAVRQQREQALLQWINASPVRQQLYGPVLTKLQQLLSRQQDMQLRDLALQYFQYARLPALARQLYETARLPEPQRRDAVAILQQQLSRLDNQFDPRVDMELALHFLWQYSQLPARLRLAALDQYFALNDGFNREIVRHKLSAIYRGTGLRDEAQRALWLQRSAQQFEQSTDPLLNFTVAMQQTTEQLAAERSNLQVQLSAARAAVMEVLLAYHEAQGRQMYAEANGTLRFSLGRVSGYQPMDAVWHQPFSSLHSYLRRQGATAKPDSASAVTTGNTAVNFLTTTDTDSHYSGAVTFNLAGELVGILYGGVQQSLLADWYYDADFSRTVHVDARFIHWQLQQDPAGRALLAEITMQP